MDVFKYEENNKTITLRITPFNFDNIDVKRKEKRKEEWIEIVERKKKERLAIIDRELDINLDAEIKENEDVKGVEVPFVEDSPALHKKQRIKLGMQKKIDRQQERAEKKRQKEIDNTLAALSKQTADFSKLVYTPEKELGESIEMWEFRRKFIRDRKLSGYIADRDSKLARNTEYYGCVYQE